MVELGARFLIAGAILFISGMFGVLDFDFAWKAAAAIATIGVFGYLLERKDLKNPGVAGFFAVADCYAIALLLARAGHLPDLGFLVLAPCAFAAARHQSPPNFMAPLAASSLLVSHAIFSEGKMPGQMLLAQACGLLVVGLLFSQTKIVTIPGEPIMNLQDSDIVLERDDYLELRENFRKLRDAYRDLEFKSRRGRMIAIIDDARAGSGEKLFQRLSNKIKEVTGADHVAVYTVAQYAEQLVVRATTTGYPAELSDVSLRVDLDLAPGQIKHRVEQSLLAIKSDTERTRVANVILIESGRVVGMITLGHTEPLKLAEAQEKADEIAPYIAAFIQEEIKAESERRRLRETELLYEVATVTAGATNVTSLASRVVRELFETIEADHVGVFLLEGNEAIQLANQGARTRLLDALKLSGGAGLGGWLSSDSPEIIVFDARDDHRVDAQEALKRRVGSFILLPLTSAQGTIGFLTAATHNRGGLDKPEIESLRISSLELAQAIQRLQGASTEPEGVMTPAEFGKRVQGAKGSFVYLEPLRREQLTETFGKPALDQALRKFVAQLKRSLPKGGCICRRDEGDYVVFLPKALVDKASSWANDVTASAAMIAVKTLDGSTKIPLALRAKVAALDKQESEVFDAITA